MPHTAAPSRAGVAISAYLDPEQVAELRARAAAADRSLAAQIRVTLRDALAAQPATRR